MSKNPVFRNCHQKDSDFYARIHCRTLGLKKGSPQYNNEYEKYVRSYLDDAKPSLYPSPEMNPFVENPTTPKIPSYIWDIFDIWQKKGFFDTFTKGMNEQDKKIKMNQFKGAVGSLVNVYLELRLNFRTKSTRGADLTKIGDISDFQYREIPGNEDAPQNEKERKQVEINRYYRLMILSIIVANLELVFNTSESDLSTVLANVDIDFKTLREKETRKNFTIKSYESAKGITSKK